MSAYSRYDAGHVTGGGVEFDRELCGPYLSHDAGQVSARGFDAGPLVAGQPLHLRSAQSHVQLAAYYADRGWHRALGRTQRQEGSDTRWDTWRSQHRALGAT